jgi:hypothetical protein
VRAVRRSRAARRAGVSYNSTGAQNRAKRVLAMLMQCCTIERTGRPGPPVLAVATVFAVHVHVHVVCELCAEEFVGIPLINIFIFIFFCVSAFGLFGERPTFAFSVLDASRERARPARAHARGAVTLSLCEGS